jgi:hypothetical protein
MKKKPTKKDVENMSDLITQAAAATLRGVSRAAIASLVKRGRLKKKILFSNVLVYRSEVMAFEREKPGPKKTTGKGKKK